VLLIIGAVVAFFAVPILIGELLYQLGCSRSSPTDDGPVFGNVSPRRGH
jgi:hypothetical protein